MTLDSSFGLLGFLFFFLFTPWPPILPHLSSSTFSLCLVYSGLFNFSLKYIFYFY